MRIELPYNLAADLEAQGKPYAFAQKKPRTSSTYHGLAKGLHWPELLLAG